MPTLIAVGLAVLAALPAALVRLGALTVPIEAATLLYGVAIVGASFALSWGAEAAEHDVPRALALSAVALLAVLPEYAVDIIFAFKAGQDPTFAAYAAANMTGSNRLLLGLGWPTVAVLAWISRGTRSVRLDRDAGLPLLFLAVATFYSFSLPLRASISPIDSVLLVALFVVYAVLAAREQTQEPDLVGPAAVIGGLTPIARRVSIVGLFLYSGITIASSAEPFATGLVETGQKLGIDQFLLVQWLAPVASEAPEFVLASLLAARGKANAALGLLLSAKVNQWTLLVGSLPLAYSVGAGHLEALPLDMRQVAEVLLTSAQGLFGVAVLASLSFELGEAALLMGLFLAQFVAGALLRTVLNDAADGETELFVFSAVYLLLSLVFLFRARHVLVTLWAKVHDRRVAADPHQAPRVT